MIRSSLKLSRTITLLQSPENSSSSVDDESPFSREESILHQEIIPLMGKNGEQIIIEMNVQL